MKVSAKMERSPTNGRWERVSRDLVRLGFSIRRIALDLTLSRRQGVDFGAPPETWEQYSKEGQIWDLCQYKLGNQKEHA